MNKTTRRPYTETHTVGHLNIETRVTPIQEQNRVKQVTKMRDGGLRVTLHSGETFMISKDDVEFQVFVIYTILADA